MSKKTPEASPKGKGKKEEEAIPPYTPEKMKVTTQCFADAELLEKKDTCIFRGEFHTPQGKKVHMVDLPDTLQRLDQDQDAQEIYTKLEIDGYFKLKPWGIDIKRAYELMTNIDEVGTVILIGEDGQPKMVVINEYIVQDALHFKEGYEVLNRRLTDSERSKVFLNMKGKQGTFKDMAIEEAKLSLQLFTKYFNLRKP